MNIKEALMIYPNQADNDRKEIIRVLSLYHCLELRQLIGLFPSIPVPSLLSLLRRLQKQGRILLQDDAVKCLPEKEPVDCMSKAIDVLLDFFPEVTYHSPGEFPVTLTFFAREEGYEVISLPEGKELLVIHALSLQHRPVDGCQRLVVLADQRQLDKACRLPDIAAFCLVSDGQVQYLKKQQGGIHG